MTDTECNGIHPSHVQALVRGRVMHQFWPMPAKFAVNNEINP